MTFFSWFQPTRKPLAGTAWYFYSRWAGCRSGVC